jgi:hypothetical protein
MPSVEERLYQLEQRANSNFTKVENMDRLLNGNSHPGFVQETREAVSEIRDFISQQKGMWKIILAMGVIITILCGIMTIRSFMGKAENNVPHYNQSSVKSQQNASDPTIP